MMALEIAFHVGEMKYLVENIMIVLVVETIRIGISIKPAITVKLAQNTNFLIIH